MRLPAVMLLLALIPPVLGQGTEKDREAILKSGRDFAAAFAQGDAKAVALHWTENGEYIADRGVEIIGRANIEKAFAQFFQAKPKGKIEVLVESLRFPSRDVAIEEGVLRQTGAGADLPSSTLYSVVHVRDGGQWKIAQAREWGAGRDRLVDLEWLVGTWKASVKDQEMTLTFTWEKTKPFITGSMTTRSKGKVVTSGTLKIGYDAERGRLRSWHFDDDGSHGQALWVRDGNRWVLDAVGMLGNGTATAAVNILTRINEQEITWRSLDRVIGGAPVPPTVPIKLTRVAGGE